MNDVEFYKDVYFRELARKESLDNNYATNVLTIVSGLVLINYFFVEKYSFLTIGSCHLIMPKLIFLISIGCFIFCIYWLAKAYNNFFVGFDYSNIPLLRDIEKAKSNFENDTFKDEITKEVIELASVFQSINTKRNYYYFKSRSWLTGCFISTAIFVLFYYLIQ